MNEAAAVNRQCLSRARWYLAQVEALLVASASKARLDEDERLLCQAMLREVKNRFGIDKTTPLADREATPTLLHYHERMRSAGARLTMATNTPPTVARWGSALQACKVDLEAYLAEIDRPRAASATTAGVGGGGERHAVR